MRLTFFGLIRRNFQHYLSEDNRIFRNCTLNNSIPSSFPSSRFLRYRFSNLSDRIPRPIALEIGLTRRSRLEIYFYQTGKRNRAVTYANYPVLSSSLPLSLSLSVSSFNAIARRDVANFTTCPRVIQIEIESGRNTAMSCQLGACTFALSNTANERRW